MLVERIGRERLGRGMKGRKAAGKAGLTECLATWQHLRACQDGGGVFEERLGAQENEPQESDAGAGDWVGTERKTAGYHSEWPRGPLQSSFLPRTCRTTRRLAPEANGYEVISKKQRIDPPPSHLRNFAGRA